MASMTLPMPTTGLLQRRFGGPDTSPEEQGDCWATAVACYGGLTEADRDELHDRVVAAGGAAKTEEAPDWWVETERFLVDRGLYPLTVVDEPEPEYVYLAVGPSPRGDWGHCVLATGDGALFWDPHPDGSGLAGEPTEWTCWWNGEES